MQPFLDEMNKKIEANEESERIRTDVLISNLKETLVQVMNH